MLPPIEPEIASTNPKFDALYRDLCSNKLHSDGTTKVDPNPQKERDALSEDLHKARVSAAKSGIIRTHLQALAYHGDELPSELRELVAIITATLSAQLSAEDTNLLRPDIESFKESIAPIASAISKAIAQDITSLSQLISPESRTDLLSKIQKSTQNIATNSQTLSTLRLDLAHNAASLQSLYLKALETSIRLLEQTIHGSISRNTKTKAEYLATVAEGMARKLQIQQNQLFTQTKSTELQEAVSLKSEELEREAMMLKRKVREMGEALAEYRESNAVEGMAREYAEIEGERERVQVDIERLEGESGR